MDADWLGGLDQDFCMENDLDFDPSVPKSPPIEVKTEIDSSQETLAVIKCELAQIPEIEGREKQLRSISKVAKVAERLGISDSVILTGGFALEAAGAVAPRKHKDVDLMVVGKENVIKLSNALHQDQSYEGYSYLAFEGDGASVLRSTNNDLCDLDFNWGTETEINGVACVIFGLDPRFQEFLGKPFGVVKEALIGRKLESGLNVLSPASISLTLSESDRASEIAYIKADQAEIDRLKIESQKAGIYLSVPIDKVNEYIAKFQKD